MAKETWHITIDGQQITVRARGQRMARAYASVRTGKPPSAITSAQKERREPEYRAPRRSSWFGRW